MKLQGVDRNIEIQSANIHLGDRLPEHAQESILRVAGKYFGRLNAASAYFTREGFTYRCTVNMQMGALPMKSAEAQDKNIYLAFNAALAKVAKQLRRTKRELRDDKAERVDKDLALRESVSRPREAGEPAGEVPIGDPEEQEE